MESVAVTIETSMGAIEAELWPDKAPKTVENFLRYVDEKHYDGVIFHRVIDAFMIQGGGFTPAMSEKPTHEPIANEASTEVGNERGTLAMARTPDPNSAGAQFYINLGNNDFLNHRAKTPEGYGYCVFGKVVQGVEVVDAIAKVKTHSSRGYDDVPVEPVEIHSVRRKE